MSNDLRFLLVQPEHHPQLLALARQLVTAADTYAFDPNISDDALLAYWVPAKPRTASFAALWGDVVVGAYVIKPNHPGPASHIANASYVVSPHVRGRGIGRRMGLHSLLAAKKLSFQAMQYNIVLASNTAAIKLWQDLGFEVRGSIPAGFRRRDGGYDDFLIMHRSLDDIE